MTTHEIISATETPGGVELKITWKDLGNTTTELYSQQVAKALGYQRPDPQPVDPAWMVEVAREAGGTGLEANGFRGAADEARIGNSDKKAPVLASITALRLALSRGHVVLAPVMPSEEEMLADAVEDAAQVAESQGNRSWARQLRARELNNHDDVRCALQGRRSVYASLGAVKAVSSGPVVPEVDLRRIAELSWDNGYATAVRALQALGDGEGNATTLYANEREKDLDAILGNLKSGEA